jgi:signal transduction histidine kinase
MMANDRRRSHISKVLAGIALPAGIALMLLAGLLIWRILILESASEAEDRADGILVASSILGTQLMHVQNQERGFLLTGSNSAFGTDVPRNAIALQFAKLRTLVDDPQSSRELRSLESQYLSWKRNADALIRERRTALHHPHYTAARLQIEPTHALNLAAQAFLEEQRAARARKSASVDAQVRGVVLWAIVGCSIVGVLLTFSTWRLLLAEAQQRRRVNELEEQNLRMGEAARVKSEFVAHMSHEFRTPLTAILGFGEMLYDEKVGPLSKTQKEYIDDILVSGRHLLGLINQVLDLAKVEAGKIAIDYVACDPRRLGAETVETLRPLARERQVALRSDFLRAPAIVISDPGRFKQILYNYLSNALAFTPAGGTVTVAVYSVADERYRIEVSDTGTGIAPADIPKLFQEFSQVESGPKRSRDGAGLGLVLTKRLVEAQGGTVGVESHLGLGSIFYAELPRDPRRREAAA